MESHQQVEAMCGIAGKLNLGGEPVEPEALERMARLLAHRGPDDQSVLLDGGLGLAARRLAILDLSPAGQQPLANEDGSIWVVFNGEIYNFPELRAELETKGHRFRSRTDTEILVHLYEEEGPGAVERLRGMFAFALWDRRRRRLLLARDRLGKKPLFYAFDGRTFRFASEMKAILADGMAQEVDPLALHYYLSYRYIPHPLTIFRSIRKLPPAHLLLLSGDMLRIKPYWQVGASAGQDGDEQALCQELVQRLQEAVRLRMASDVPVGAFLSGGIDSSAVVALMAEVSPAPVRTFAVGFEGDGDDLERARRVARAFGTAHHELVVKPDAVGLLPRLVCHLDEPFGDPSIIPTWYLARFAREHVTVALNGDGGDETFAGYGKYWQNRAAGWLGVLPRPFHDGLLDRSISFLRRLAPETRRLTSLQAICRSASLSHPERYAVLSGTLEETARAKLYTADFRAAIGNPPDLLAERYRAIPIEDRVNRMLAADASGFLPDDLLYKMDMATMAHGLEARSPFLDHRFVEFAFGIPGSFKLRGLRRKFILKKALSGILPADLLSLPKRGFDPPVARWLREDLREMAADLLLDGTARGRGYLRAPFVEALLDAHRQRRADWSPLLWKLLVLELWHRTRR
ncbi:MAG: asparagine synthase (glutamine-hydrolyzing) [Candidatus Rokubacteria bacterium]|nr:asparagine synthase (glutamine-hydrolyzing) [Candidatus Rokubacteria bacterium]